MRLPITSPSSSASGRRLTGRRGRCCCRCCCCCGGTGTGISGHGVCMDGVHGRLSGTDIVWEKRYVVKQAISASIILTIKF